MSEHQVASKVTCPKCGSSNVTGPDAEDFRDCLDCRTAFPEMNAIGWENEAGKLPETTMLKTLERASGQSLSKEVMHVAGRLAETLPRNATIETFIRKCHQSTLQSEGWSEGDASVLGQLGAVLDLHIGMKDRCDPLLSDGKLDRSPSPSL